MKEITVRVMTNTCVTLDSFHRVSNTLIWPSKEFLNPCLINEKKESQSYKWELLHLFMIMSANEVGHWFLFNNFKCLLMLNLWKPPSLPSVTCFLYWPVVAAITPYCPLSFLSVPWSWMYLLAGPGFLSILQGARPFLAFWLLDECLYIFMQVYIIGHLIIRAIFLVNILKNVF